MTSGTVDFIGVQKCCQGFTSSTFNHSSNNVTEQTYFEVLNCEPVFDINEKTLVHNLRSLQSQWHPDFYGQSSKEVQEQAASFSAAVNRAYAVLKKPHLRAKYLLELKGFPLTEEDTAMDISFLEHIMALREQVQDTTDQTHLRKIQDQVQPLRQTCLQKLSIAFRENRLEEAKEETQKLQYYERLVETLSQKLD
eukprot:jgi/Galph1/3350/GphlegSOOS_G2021.1